MSEAEGPWTKFAASPVSAGGPWAKFQAAPASPPETTAGGVAGSITRGLAPIATGAALGAAAGAPIGGVGAIPGAAAGAGAVGLTELATHLYNPLAKRFGWPEVATPQEMTDRVLDAVGVKRPSTGAERGAEAVSGGAAGALGPAKAAGVIADQAASSVVKGAATRLAEKPALQATSGALGGAAGQAAAEAGAGPLGQAAASSIGGMIPYGPAAARGAVAAEPRQAAIEARQAGYVLPPAAISEKPGIISNVIAGWGGKIKTAQQASANNQSVTNGLSAQALGLPKDTVLNEQVFEDIRHKAGQAYQAVARAIPVIQADSAYDSVVAGLGGRNGQAAQLFPKITKNPGIQDLVDELTNVRQFPTGTGLEIVKELRFNANSNLKALGDPSKHALGLAQREAANAIDDLMDRNIVATGQTGVVDAYRQARQLIAKSYDIEGATNIATGDVNARGLSRLSAKGRPLTGELDTIANAAAAFPKAMQPPAGFGYDEKFSALDFFGAAASALHGRLDVAGAILGRPVARSAVLSKPYQNAIMDQRPNTIPLPVMMNPGMESIVQPDRAKAAMGLQ